MPDLTAEIFLIWVYDYCLIRRVVGIGLVHVKLKFLLGAGNFNLLPISPSAEHGFHHDFPDVVGNVVFTQEDLLAFILTGIDTLLSLVQSILVFFRP